MSSETYTVERTPIRITKAGRKHMAEFKCWRSDKPKLKVDVVVGADTKDDLKRKVAEFLEHDDLPEFLAK